jgi:hypothetical protein
LRSHSSARRPREPKKNAGSFHPTKTGWWLTYPSEKYDIVQLGNINYIYSPVGIIIPNIWKNDPSVPNHQPDDA